MRVALVEPSRTVRRIVTDMIQEWDHDVRAFANGEEALAGLQSDQDIRALVTSAELASISGFELIAAARNAVGHRPLYIVLMSSIDEYTRCVQALDNGADDFICKPPIKEELRARLRTADRVTSMQRELVKLATTDFLTGLPNRRAFFEKAAHAPERALRGEPLSVLMLDLDHFKQINDTHGHEAGDQVLRAVSSELATMPGLAGRLGGEEFASLLGKRLDDAMETAELVREAIGNLVVRSNDVSVPVTCSIGVTEWEPGDTIDALLRRADVALYEAKRSGRNRVVAADSFSVSDEHRQWRGAARLSKR
jgi:diguanylate cyclase (GGDEF)-like protein